MRKILIFVFIVLFFAYGCEQKEVNVHNNQNQICQNLDFYDDSKNKNAYCQLLKIFDESCIDEIKDNKLITVIRIRHFTLKDTGCYRTIYKESNCAIYKVKKASKENFHLVIRENTGEGYQLALRKSSFYQATNRIINNIDLSKLIKIINSLPQFTDDGEIRDMVEILENGTYHRYDCNERQGDSILNFMQNLK